MSLYAELMPVYLTGPFLTRPLLKGFEITGGALEGLGSWKGTTAEVHVNGQKAGQICWPPYELMVGHLLKEGDNEITVKVVGSLKNTFGHFFRTWDSCINGPGDWNQAPDEIPSLDQYSLMY